MGKRSRSRVAERRALSIDSQTQPGADAAKSKKPQRRDRVGRAIDQMVAERPEAPWHPFPLVELSIFIGMLAMFTGLVVQGGLGKALVIAGLVLASIAGLENAAREHFTGYRSHASLIAAAIGIATIAVTSLALHTVLSPAIRLGIGISVMLTVFQPLRRVFLRRSGGKRL